MNFSVNHKNGGAFMNLWFLQNRWSFLVSFFSYILISRNLLVFLSPRGPSILKTCCHRRFIWNITALPSIVGNCKVFDVKGELINLITSRIVVTLDRFACSVKWFICTESIRNVKQKTQLWNNFPISSSS